MLGLADVTHQRGHGSALSRIVATQVTVPHITPVKRRATQTRIGKVYLIGIIGTDIQGRSVGSDSADRCGILPVVEHHRSRGCRATGHALVSPVVVGKLTLVVIRSRLVPVTSQQGAIGNSAQFRAHLRLFLDLQFGIVKQERNLFLVVAEHINHRRGKIVDVGQRAVTNHQNNLSTVITSDNEEGSRRVVNVIDRISVLDIVTHLGLQENGIQSSRSHHLAGIHLIGKIILSHLSRRILIDRGGL